MRPVVLFLTVLGWAAASPNGYYSQSYDYKSSSSSYKNNELQHKTDDQGYYRKHGDLEGKTRPRVDANSEHSEYVNPNLRNNEYNTGLVGGANGDLSSYGHLRADSYGSQDLSSEGTARADHIVGTKSGAYSGYSSGSYGSSNYGSQSYGTSSNLRSITSHIQQELERELQNAIQEQRSYSQSGVSVSDLERELRQNLTSRLNSELANRYGQQSVRGGLSYTISGGRLHSTANYDNQELQDLRSQLENNLLNQLRSQYRSSSSRYESHQSSQNNYGYSTTAVPVYYQPHQPQYRPVTPTYSVNYIPSSQIRYTPVPNPESITTIASRVQTQLDSRLNELLEDAQRRYFSSGSSYSLTNVDVVLENLRNELRNNITYLLNENVKSNYGNQIPRDGYMYSTSPSGQTSSQYNYAISDLENLRSQVERNLIEKLNRDFETYKTRWYQQSSHSQSQVSHGSSGTKYGGYIAPQYNSYSTPRYDSYSTPRYDSYSTPRYNQYDSEVEHFSTRPAASHIVPLITSGSNSGGRYNLLAGSSQSGYEVSSGSGGSSISELQSRLQQDLSRQLQAAISRGHYGTYSSSGSYSAPSYQSSLQELSNELNRNLTKQLQEYSASGYYSSYGNFDQSQLASLRNQLQADLMRQLQQGLQQSFQSSSSFSASSSSSGSSANYRPTRGYDSYQSGQYRSGGNVLSLGGADCVGDDPNAYNSHRMKRSYPPYRSRPIGLGYSSNAGYTSNYGYSGRYNQQQELGQQVDDSDLTQQVEDVSSGKLQQGSLSQQQQVALGQQIDDSDLTQQVEDSGFGKFQLGSQQQIGLSQQVDDPDLTQQVEEERFGKLQLGSENQLTYGQQVDESDLTQQVETEPFGRLQLGSQNQQQVAIGQQVDDTDLSQQVQSQNLEQVEPSQQVGYGQELDDSRLTQQTENEHFGKPNSQNRYQFGYGQRRNTNSGRLQFGSQIQQTQTVQDLTQQVDTDLTQQTEDEDFGKYQVGAHNQQQVSQNQQIRDLDLTQQTQDLTQQTEDLTPQTEDLTQQTEDSNNGKLQLGSQVQEQVDLDSDDQSQYTQQVENVRLGRLQLGSQRRQQIQFGQVEDSDSTQQVEDLHGQQLVQQREDTDNSDLTQQVEEVNFGGQVKPVDNSKLTEQVGGSGLGKLQRSSYGTTTQRSNWNYGYINYPLNQQNNLGQEEDNSDLTQQIQSGSVQSPQQVDDFGRFTSQGQINLGHQQTLLDSNNRFESNFNQNQKQLALQLENELSRQLKDAVRNYYTSSYSRLNNYQTSYQDLVKELERNLTRQLQATAPSGGSTRYSYSFVFSGPQRILLKQQLEDDLKSQLQREITISSASTNFGQQQIHQELSNNDLNQNIGSQSQTQQNINSELTQQQQNGFENVDIEGQSQTQNEQIGDLTQQVDQQQNEFGQEELTSGALVQSNNNGRLELGTQQIEQQSVNNQNDLTQQVDTNHLGSGHQDFGSQYPNQYQNPLLSTQYSSSGRLQFGRRPTNQKPIDNTNFINTEITQQQQLYPNQHLVSQQVNNKPNNLPTLNQVTTQEQDNVEVNTDYANNLDQQETDDLADGGIPRGSTQNSVGQSTIVQGFATNKPFLYAQILRQGNRVPTTSESAISQTGQQTNSFSQHQGSFSTYLNSQQVELAYQLQNELSKQLQDAISENQYALSQSTLSGGIREQFLRELQRNITKQLEQIFNANSYSSYSSYSNSILTPAQKDKLQRDILSDLTGQLQVTYNQQNNGQNSFHTDVITSGSLSPFGTESGRLYNSYEPHVNRHETQDATDQLNYGQQVAQETETVSDLQPLQPQQATVVQNVDPEASNYNVGIKGSGRFRVNSHTPPSNVIVVPEVHQTPPELAPVPPNADQQSVPQEVPDLNATPQEDLPWWKRVGHKIRQGASNLKEKIIG